MSKPLDAYEKADASPRETAFVSADAAALQKRDAFDGRGWLRILAPAKVNLHLAIGDRRPDGYHDAVSIMHALALHDTVYVRRATPVDLANEAHVAHAGRVPLAIEMLGSGDIEVPEVAPDKNVAARAVQALAEIVATRDGDAGEGGAAPVLTPLCIHVDKGIPAQAGLGGGSADATAALVGAAALWGLDSADPAIEQAAQSVGSDVAFFLRGGCGYYSGTGEVFEHALRPMNGYCVLVKPDGGVSTAAAYKEFDRRQERASEELAARARAAERAQDVPLFNNLAPASEALMPELAEVRTWLLQQQGVSAALLCGSGSTTFAPCADFTSACAVVAAARQRGWWARSTMFSAIGASMLGQAGGVR